jgi:hypothetical protein
MQVCQELLNHCEDEGDSSAVMRCGVATISQNQNLNTWSGDMQMLYKESSRSSHQQVK